MLKELNQAVEYIEENLCEDINWKEWFKAHAINEYHFKTIFFHLTGLTLNEYIKKRRIAMANEDLLKGLSVTDVAYKYAYQSIDGFTRAFKKELGYLPSEVQKHNIKQMFSKLHFSIEVKGGDSMEYKIVKMPAFTLAGVKSRVPMQFEGVNQEIVKLVESITTEQKELMHELMNLDPKEVVNASYDADYLFQEEKGDLTHFIGVLTTETNIDEKLDTYFVEVNEWAVFPNEGKFPETLQNTMADIYAKWLLSSDYIILPLPSFSFTHMKEDGINAYSEIWIPVEKKSE
ncbi:GyrI-like domain-containing protein [Ornithinibacillus sp. 4-3]|uniref:GyrI-like domain-containing protein n=1 Tax=Ornithinibacillus sp. 4-3 TaxID=3231488 RepID=A0AB39HRZ0_9BACI